MLPHDCKLNDNMRKQIKSYTTRKNMDDNLKLNLVPRVFHPREERPWFRLVTCLPKSGRRQKKCGSEK